MGNEKPIIEKYFKLLPKYEKLGENLKNAFQTLLKENEVDILTIKFRIKKLDDFLEKIERKGYKNPFNEMEDICGIRVICYFPSEIELIKKVIEREFDVVEIINKDNKHVPTQFGYRSQHYVLKIKKDWAKTPHFRGLDNLKFELQLRTVLMHAWGEIEHKLAYKKFEHMPPQFRRKFSLLSAKLEEADEQFEELMKKIKDYKKIVNLNSQRDADINLDNLLSFWDDKYPKSQRKVKEMRDFLDKIHRSGISFNELSKIIDEKGLSEKNAINKVLNNRNASKKF